MSKEIEKKLPVGQPRLVLPLWEWIETNTPIEMWVSKADESTEYMVIRQRKEWLSRVCYGTRYKRVVSVWDNPNHTEPSLEDAKLQCAHHYLQNAKVEGPAVAATPNPNQTL